jgi:hypothetical protein
MRVFSSIIMMSALLAAAWCGTVGATGGAIPPKEPEASEWRQEFGISGRDMVSAGRSTYFVLEPGFQLVFESEDAKLVITVLDDTVDVGGVTVRVVEEREWEEGKLIEVSWNLFAIDKDNKDVFYFGEDVDVYKDGKITGHGGSWRAEKDGARPGLIMPGTPAAGMKYYQEMAPGIAMDRAEVISVDEKFKTPAGTFKKCLKTMEGSGLNPDEKEFKIYAPGIGLVKDGDMLLVKYGFSGEEAVGQQP